MTDETPEVDPATLPPLVIPDTLEEAYRESVENAVHLRARQYLALITAGLKLARKIDRWDEIVSWAEEDAEENGGRPAVPQNDNVSISAFAKICDQLGIAPVSARALRAEAGPPRPKRGGDDDASAGTGSGKVSSIAARRARGGRPA